ncbi:MAG: NAD(P)-dependent oxidoreductase [Saprospiraceae bacterium]
MIKKILITDKVHHLLIDGLKGLGCEVIYDTSVDNATLNNIIGQFDGVIINSKIIMDKARIDLGIKLKFIGRLGSGLEIIDVPYAQSKGIKVHNSPEGNRNAVAEHEVGMILSLMNHLLRADREVRELHWDREKNRGMEINGKTIGIIGLGHTGGAFATKWQGWGCRVISYDKYKTSYDPVLNFVEKTDFESILSQSDIISFHLPLTAETTHMVDTSFLYQCKPGVIISNTSRGQVIDTIALVEALKNGQVSGACLDVFENEKPNHYSTSEMLLYRELFSFDNVILSPHIAGWTKESLEGIARVLLDKIVSAHFKN